MRRSESELRLENFDYLELRRRDGLARLDRAFLEALHAKDTDLHARLCDYRNPELDFSEAEISAMMVTLAPHLETYLSRLFSIGVELEAARNAELGEDVVLDFKKQIVQRRARRYRRNIDTPFAALDAWLNDELAARGLDAGRDRELAVARLGARLLAEVEREPDDLERLVQWCALSLREPLAAGVEQWVSFQLARRIDHARLVPLSDVDGDRLGRLQTDPKQFRRRDGFRLTDGRMSRRQVRDEVRYCIYCHDHDGDFCAKGFPEKKGEPSLGLKMDPLGVTLTGCPLEMKISEMNLLKREGYVLAALAAAMADNPMVPATGHRICNDCMKGCIYQKQEPVDIPQIETRVLTDVLALPWGVEIYDLLTRWNPLRRTQYLPKAFCGRRVLIAGMGPAGFTMAHHLAQEGCAVVGIDGLKIEPLPDAFIERPIRDWSSLTEELDERVLLGFGGVAEYGITVRWDKNFLKLIYLSLLRREHFQIFGGVRFGGTITLDDAWGLGFDHVCVATGAGLPKVIHMGESLARGMRQANDFLMALQLTGAGKDSSLANLQVRLPAVVIGGGLTAIDTANEVQAHYVKQVEKVLIRYRNLVATRGEDAVRRGMSPEDEQILDEFLSHGRAVEAERQRARKLGVEPDLLSLTRAWGGVTLAYRKGLNASPAYQRNHEEVAKALEEGLFYAEGLAPLRTELDDWGHVVALRCRVMRCVEGRWMASNEEIALPARSVFVAAGAQPNTIYEHEHPGSFELEADHFLPHIEHQGQLQPTQVAEHCKSPEFAPFTSYESEGRFVSFLGDTHPVFHGSVVKAIASAKRSYPDVMSALEAVAQEKLEPEAYPDFRSGIANLLVPTIAAVDTSRPSMAELWVRAPLAARNFRPGQFFRLQTYETTSPLVEGSRLQIPLMTVSGTGVRGDRIRLLVLQWGGISRLVGRLRVGDEVVLMGPTGAPTDMPSGQTIMIVAGRWGAAVMLDIGPALRAAGNRVIYVAALNSAAELDHRDELESAADEIVWCTANEPAIEAHRPGDSSVVCNDVLEALGELAPLHTDLNRIDRIMVMGATGLLRAFQELLVQRPGTLFRSDVEAVGTVGSPMQCMLKGVCAQCLQWQVDPESGERTRAVFSCAGQDQPLTWIDLENLSARQSQNRVLDRLSALWLDELLEKAAPGTSPQS